MDSSKPSTKKFSEADVANLRLVLRLETTFTSKVSDAVKFVEKNALKTLIELHPFYSVQNGLIVYDHQREYRILEKYFLSYPFKGMYEFYYGYFTAKQLEQLVNNLLACYRTNKAEKYRKSSLYSLRKIKTYLSTAKDTQESAGVTV